MTPTLTVSLLWLLAMLAGVGLCGRAPLRVWPLTQLALTIALTALAARFVSPQPDWVAIVTALIAAWRLLGRPSTRADVICGGIAVGLALALHLASGVAPAFAFPLAILPAVVAVTLWRGRTVASPSFRELALAVSALVAPAVGLAAQVANGWRAASVLNRAAEPAASIPVPVWAGVFVALALLAGVIKGIWVRR